MFPWKSAVAKKIFTSLYTEPPTCDSRNINSFQQWRSFANLKFLEEKLPAARSPPKGITVKKSPLEINGKKRKSEFSDDDHHNDSSSASSKMASAYSRDEFPNCSIVEDYESLGTISKGSFGVVYKVRERGSGEILAMKEEFDGLSPTSLMEVEILKRLGRHPSVVEFKNVAVDEYDGVYVVMEYLETDLKRYLSQRKHGLREIEAKELTQKLLQGVKFMHEKGVMHRDLKTSNVLINSDGRGLKICDFGTAAPMDAAVYSTRVGTLWYRAPELFLLRDSWYSCAVNMWAVGCIMAELLLKEALFQGEDDYDQYLEILRIVGLPLKVKRDLSEPRYSIRDEFATAGAVLSEEGFDLLTQLLRFDPRKRITAECALNHAWFHELSS